MPHYHYACFEHDFPQWVVTVDATSPACPQCQAPMVFQGTSRHRSKEQHAPKRIAELERERDEARARVEEYKALARYANNMHEYAEFHAKHPLANSIELWGAAMGRKAHEVAEAQDAARTRVEELEGLLREARTWFDRTIDNTAQDELHDRIDAALSGAEEKGDG